MIIMQLPGATVVRRFENDGGGSLQRQLHLRQWWWQPLHCGSKDIHWHSGEFHMVVCLIGRQTVIGQPCLQACWAALLTTCSKQAQEQTSTKKTSVQMQPQHAQNLASANARRRESIETSGYYFD